MTAASFAQAGQPVSNSTKEMSSDEEDFVSSPSTPTASADALTQARLSTAMDQLQLGNRRPQSPPDNQTAPHKTSSSAEASTAFRTSENAKKKPLALLDLPWDILKEIVKEITHTDDLTSLALTCSALHDLAIPYLYSRFDIVWPEVVEDSSADGSSGVDALSHGLSTLVMGEGIFHQLPQMAYPSTSSSCSLCGCDGRAHASSSGANTRITECASRPRRGNYYAQYTRTFSIANGPISWIREYSVNREVGKMLGTLVALAVARMVNLEAFIWDMPTGVVREIWLALASLANRPGHECRLEQVWVRWHDNKQNLLRANHTSFPRLPRNWRDTRIEYPSLSILPPLKSITVLEIDETAYLDELAVLIERSRTRLIELRIGITSRVRFFNAFLCQKDSDEPNAGWPKPGGVLSVLSCAVENGACRWHEASTQFTHADGSSDHGLDSAATPQQPTEVSSDRHVLPGNEKEQSQDLGDEDQSHTHSNISVPIGEGLASSGPPRHGQLKLRVLELERVHLHAPTLLAAIDWTCLVALTLLGCKDDEQLWKALRRKYSPSVITPPKRTCDQTSSPVESEYPLNLKHLHTDNVSPYLMLFVKESLAPNTLESVYLHEPVHPELSVPIDAIYKYILRRHRLSLRRVLVASPDQSDPDEPRIWMFTREIISFVTSGRMPQLSELGMAIDHSSWHHFLRRIPNMSQLFALYLAKIDHSPQPELRELGLQILDIVSIRPDLKLTYIGVQSKCYQIEEASPGDVEYDAHQHPDSDYETGDPNEESDLGDDSELDSPEQSYISDPLSSGLSDDSDIEIGDDGEPRARLWLHEIPYCDDKISIFKARHAMI